MQAIVNTCTNDMLIRPDLTASIQLVDLINTSRNQIIIGEIVYFIRTKMGSFKTARTVQLALHLIECLAKNCGIRLHTAINDESFMDDMMKVARKYTSKTGADNRAVAELVLDIIQGWGEAFLPKQKQFPNIVKAYHTLRKEGLPFKPQYDSSRVPIFTPSVISNGISDPDTDGILAATIAASMSDRSNSSRPPQSSAATPNRQPNRPSNNTNVNTGRSAVQNDSPANTLHGILTILFDMVELTVTERELKENEILTDITSQLQQSQGNMGEIIEVALVQGSKDVDKLLVLNDAMQHTLIVYNNVKRGATTIVDAKKEFTKIKNVSGLFNEIQQGSVTKAAPNASVDLLGVGTTPDPKMPSNTSRNSDSSRTSGSDINDLFGISSIDVNGNNSANSGQSAKASIDTTANPVVISPLVPKLNPPPSGKIFKIAPPPSDTVRRPSAGSNAPITVTETMPTIPIQAKNKPVEDDINSLFTGIIQPPTNNISANWHNTSHLSQPIPPQVMQQTHQANVTTSSNNPNGANTNTTDSSNPFDLF